jgi:hypothetical protein
MSRTRPPIAELRQAIDLLPLRTRTAMLEGIRSNEIIVGAYSDRMGGVCPMLAAHRCGGRTSFISFARAWDRFSGAKRARRATARELRALEANLEASIAAARGTGLGWLRARRADADAERALDRVEREAERV